MLFLQGTRDELADLDLIRSVTERLGEKATLKTFEDGDHSFHVRVKSGWNDAQVMAALVETAARWMAERA
jgi:predicted alpha/beta-hydrolase family hydrolase